MMKKQIRKIIKTYEFMTDSKLFTKFITNNIGSFNMHSDIVKKEDDTICIVVQPWGGEAVPWYAITLALLLKEKAQNNIIILFDDLFFGQDKFFFNTQKLYIEKNLKQLLPYIEYVKLSSFTNNDCLVDDNYINHLASLNSIHYVKGETRDLERKAYTSIIKHQFNTIYPAAVEYFNTVHIDKIIIPGGIWGSSGIIRHIAKNNKIKIMSYDSGEGRLLFSSNGIAAQLSDIPISFEYIIRSKQDKEFAIKRGREQLTKRRLGNDMYNHFGNSELDSRYPIDSYLMLLNSVWDSAALGLHTVYESMIDWILDTIEWVIHNTNNWIIIRQHPAEKEAHINNTDDYGEKIIKKFGENNRIIFIRADNAINTYNLMEQSKCILGFSSTSIVEAVALNKPAIIVSDVYYSGFGIVYKANNKQEYYTFLKDAEDKLLKIDETMIERAYISNYITQSCNWLYTIFTPHRSDFLKWSKNNIYDIPEISLLTKAILSEMPVSLQIHNKNFND